MSKVCPTSQFHTKLVSSTKNVGRNASWERFRTNFIHILAYLSQGEDGFPTEMCLFGEVAAFQVLAVQTGHWQAWHENLVLQVTPLLSKGFLFFFQLKDLFFVENCRIKNNPHHPSSL